MTRPLTPLGDRLNQLSEVQSLFLSLQKFGGQELGPKDASAFVGTKMCRPDARNEKKNSKQKTVINSKHICLMSLRILAEIEHYGARGGNLMFLEADDIQGLIGSKGGVRPATAMCAARAERKCDKRCQKIAY